jgi:hypothetical protein
MAVSWGSDTVNGQLVPRYPASAVFPLVFSAQYTGPGMWPKQGTYQVPPVLPSVQGRYQSAPGSYGNASAPNVITGPAFPTVSSETGNVFHPTKSPLVFGLLFLVVGILMLHHIHW